MSEDEERDTLVAKLKAQAVPASVVAWLRAEVRKLPFGSGTFEIATGVTLGEIRAWLEVLDEERTVDVGVGGAGVVEGRVSGEVARAG